MTFSRRQFLGLGGGIAASLSLAACGTNTGRASASPEATGPKADLAQWYHQYGEEGVQDAVNKYASEYSGANVTVTWVASDYEKALGAALLTDKAPDVFEYANGPTLDMIRAGQVVDLTDIAAEKAAEFAPPIFKRMQYDGKLWAIPQTIDMQLLYYRKSALTKAGVQPPQTLAELASVAGKVATKTMGGFFAGNDGGLGVLGNVLIWASGLEQFNDDRSAVGFANDAMAATLTAYRDLFASNGLVKSASADWYDASAFINEETAMQWGGLWDLPKVMDAHGDDVGVLPFPAAGASGRQVVPFGAFSACVNAKSKNVEAAKQFVKWLWIDSDDKQIEFSNAFGTHIPAKTTLFGKADKVASGLGADAAKYVTDFGQTNDLFWAPAISDAYTATLEKVIKGKADAAAELKTFAEKAAKELTRLKG